MDFANEVNNLIQAIKDIAPEVWAILIKQVYVTAWGKMTFAVIFAIIGMGINKKILPKVEDDTKVGAAFLMIMCFMLSIGLAISAIQWFANPEFYAIRYILQQIN